MPAAIYDEDTIAGGPPLPPMPTAKGEARRSTGSSTNPSSASASSDSYGTSNPMAAAAILGVSPAMELQSDLAQLAKLVQKLSARIPALSVVAAPFIEQIQALGAAALADLAQGGTGSIDLGTGAPPPMMPGMAPPAAPAPGGPVGFPSGAAGAGGGMIPPMP